MSKLMDTKGAGDGATDSAPESGRRGSLLVDTRLASEEDAAVLAKMGYSGLHFLFPMVPD